MKARPRRCCSHQVGAAHRLLGYKQLAALILRPRAMCSTTQPESQAVCAAQACVCSGQLLCGSLTPPHATAFQSASWHCYSKLSPLLFLLAKIAPCYFYPSDGKKPSSFKTTFIFRALLVPFIMMFWYPHCHTFDIFCLLCS